ncbi:MAG: CpaF family protein [Lachnospiraceae bacterium]|nr:CpaF family protein [Lachnospiraceae bacterium]
MEFEHIRKLVVEKINAEATISDDELKSLIVDVVSQYYAGKKISVNKRFEISKSIFDSIRGLDVLQKLIEDESITEIMINGPDNIFIEKDGKIVKSNERFSSKEKLTDIIQIIVAKANRRVNDVTPIVDTRLPGGDRVNVVLDPIAINGPVVTIRKFLNNAIDMDYLLSVGSITREAALFLKKLVVSGYNIFVSGSTGSGKTTFLNILSNYIPREERIITIEDSAELKILNNDNLVSLEVRQANTEGKNEITIRDLIKSSLRMRPDRIIVGEIRGAEALDMLQAMNTGHDGSLSTGHANSPADMLTRIETMVLMGSDIPLAAVKSQIASAIDIIVHLGRMKDKSRKVLEIDEIEGMKDGEIVINPLFTYNDGLKATGKALVNDKKLRIYGEG